MAKAFMTLWTVDNLSTKKCRVPYKSFSKLPRFPTIRAKDISTLRLFAQTKPTNPKGIISSNLSNAIQINIKFKILYGSNKITFLMICI